MHTRGFVAGVMMVVVMAAVFVILRTVPEQDTEVRPHVTLTKRGFEPEEITVPRGTVVRFSSTLGSQYWPASNLHPDHTIYPEFDPRRPLLPDETWDFVFDRPGVWRYHDHLRSYYTGIIYVE